MDLKQKLGHLRPRRSAPSQEPERGEALNALRAQMAAILAREAPLERREPRPRVEPLIRELPFARIETDSGPLHQRIERLAPSHHIGIIPVDAALAVSGAALALLALDPALGSIDPSRVLFLDTETTGLGGSGTIAFLVGLATFEDGVLVTEQLILRTPDEEVPLLQHVARRIEAASFLVTFNGKAFDIPTLAGRYVMNRLPVPPPRPHLDLLHIARRLHKSRIRSCTLKAVEAMILGFVRDADIDGGDVAPRYGHFLRTGDESVLQCVVDHNAWDVVSMAALLGLYGEPLTSLHEEDLVGLARTYRRARALDAAREAAERAVQRGAGAEGLRVRAEIAKARGDKQRALEDFEELARTVDDPRARFELVKLYEHFVKAPARALEALDAGTGETPEAVSRRRARLERKATLGREKR